MQVLTHGSMNMPRRRGASAPANKAPVVEHVRYLIIRPDPLIEVELPVWSRFQDDWTERGR